jgi:hypothetical protein
MLTNICSHLSSKAKEQLHVNTPTFLHLTQKNNCTAFSEHPRQSALRNTMCALLHVSMMQMCTKINCTTLPTGRNSLSTLLQQHCDVNTAIGKHAGSLNSAWHGHGDSCLHSISVCRVAWHGSGHHHGWGARHHHLR